MALAFPVSLPLSFSFLFLKKIILERGRNIDQLPSACAPPRATPARAPTRLFGGFTINPGPAYQSSILCGGSDLGVPEEGLDGETGVSDLSHCFLETSWCGLRTGTERAAGLARVWL